MRETLGFDARELTPTVVLKIAVLAAETRSFVRAEKVVSAVAGLEVSAKTITYLEHNQGRMNYPEYRRQGLPITTAWMESLVKEINYRVKGTEMFWNDPEGAEAILQVRAAALCDDDRLVKHLQTRPGHPFIRRPRLPILIDRSHKS